MKSVADTKHMIISIVIPVHNEAGNIEQLAKEIDNALQKSSYNTEVIFVNDASTDNTGEILNRLEKLYSFVKVLNLEERGGQTGCFQKGFQEAKGKYIIRMDGDLQDNPLDLILFFELLGQDPDIIMVGEIRDKETAMLAVQAALTGHLVFSTLHTNNAVGVIPRLIDMGVDPYLIAPTLVLAIAQRLVKGSCEESKEPIPIEDSIKVMIDKQIDELPESRRKEIKSGKEVYRARKSPTCPGGTRGRIGVHEMFEINKDVERIILTNPSEIDIENHIRSAGMLNMKDDALIKAFEGVIPFEEVSKL